MAHTLKLLTCDFLGAIKALNPFRTKKDSRSGLVDIAFYRGSVVFSTRGVKTRCLAIDANWPGYASVDKAVLLSFLKVPPASEFVNISFDNGKLKIESFSVKALWAQTPDWIAEMSTEARLHEGPEDIYAEIRNCKTRSQCKNLWSELQATPDPKIRECLECKSFVYFCADPKELQRCIAQDDIVALKITRLKGRNRK